MLRPAAARTACLPWRWGAAAGLRAVSLPRHGRAVTEQVAAAASSPEIVALQTEVQELRAQLEVIRDVVDQNQMKLAAPIVEGRYRGVESMDLAQVSVCTRLPPFDIALSNPPDAHCSCGWLLPPPAAVVIAAVSAGAYTLPSPPLLSAAVRCNHWATGAVAAATAMHACIPLLCCICLPLRARQGLSSLTSTPQSACGRLPMPLTYRVTAHAQLTKMRNIKYFSDLQLRMVELLSLEEGALPVGSFKYLCMAYPGDIDMCETLVGPIEPVPCSAVAPAPAVRGSCPHCHTRSCLLSGARTRQVYPETTAEEAAVRAAERIQNMARHPRGPRCCHFTARTQPMCTSRHL